MPTLCAARSCAASARCVEEVLIVCRLVGWLVGEVKWRAGFDNLDYITASEANLMLSLCPAELSQKWTSEKAPQKVPARWNLCIVMSAL